MSKQFFEIKKFLYNNEKDKKKLRIINNEKVNENNNININEHNINNIIDNNFCEKCSVIYNNEIKCIKHNKYNYKLELSPYEILKEMNKNTIDNYKNKNYEKIDRIYLNCRKNLFNILNKISKRLKLKSQTYFLSIYLLDIIFSNEESVNIIKNEKLNYDKLSLSCLLISSKYCENDPLEPELNNYINNFEISTFYIQTISNEELIFYEVLSLKLLQYKLNYYSIYDFITFFFCHGIITEEQIKELKGDFKYKKILEKIYIKSRDYLNDIISKVYSIKFNSCYLAIFILEKSINEILKYEFKKDYFSEIFEKIYNINYKNDDEYIKIKDEINKIENFKNDYQKKKDLSPLKFISNENINSNIINNSKKNTIIFSRNRNEKQRKNVFTSLIKNDKYQKNKFDMTIFQPTFIQSNNQKNKRAITILNDYNTSSNIIKPMNSFNQTLQIINNSSLYEHSKSLNKNKTKEFNDTNIYNNSKVNIKKNKPSTIIINNNININIGNLYKTYTNNYTTITKKPISNNYFKTNSFNYYN
jgi:hypothetical protein